MIRQMLAIFVLVRLSTSLSLIFLEGGSSILQVRSPVDSGMTDLLVILHFSTAADRDHPLRPSCQRP
jgi:hypothetical protein